MNDPALFALTLVATVLFVACLTAALIWTGWMWFALTGLLVAIVVGLAW